jgi:hypothetical protein
MSQWQDNIKMDPHEVEQGLVLDCSGLRQGQGAGCFEHFNVFVIKNGEFFKLRCGTATASKISLISGFS